MAGINDASVPRLLPLVKALLRLQGIHQLQAGRDVSSFFGVHHSLKKFEICISGSDMKRNLIQNYSVDFNRFDSSQIRLSGEQQQVNCL